MGTRVSKADQPQAARAKPVSPLARARRFDRFWQVRNLLPLWIVRELRAQYRQSAFDIGWSLATPVITLAGFGFVLTRAFGVDGNGVPYIVMAWTGIVVWQFASSAMIRGASSLVWSADLVRKVAFPREVVPLATVGASMLDLVIGLFVLAGLMLLEGLVPTVTAVAAVLVLGVLVLWAAAIAILLATVTTFMRDFAHGLAVVLRVGIFVTPVMYPASDIPSAYSWALEVNPIAVFIESLRRCLYSDQWPEWDLLTMHGLSAVLILGFGLWYLRRIEGTMADVI